MPKRSFFPTVRAALLAGVAIAFAHAASAQATPDPSTTAIPPTTQTQTSSQTNGNVTTTTSTTTDTTGKPVQSVASTMTFHRGKKKTDDADANAKVVSSKSTKKAVAKEKKAELVAGQDSKLPDKQLYDKAVVAMNKGHFDVARLDLQTMLNTYPNSEYQMRAKLAVADSWYKEGGTAALTQAESEYADFRVFFPNSPEAAEAQMRIGDIYFRQMDRPDRDYQKSVHAEEEYRRMLTDYPQSTLVPQAKQRLREVQEVLATRESDIASYYATRDNYAAVIARYQTVVDTYPLYSHMDDVLIGLGDAFEAQARLVRSFAGLPEAGKAKLEQLYDGEAADAYRKVVLEHSAAQHVEDARDRLAAMNLPVPTPTPEQVAASEALENSRSAYRIADYAKIFILHSPDTVIAAHTGEPTLTDPKMTIAPTIVTRAKTEFANAFAATPPPATTAAVPATPDATVAATPATPAVPAAPLAFEDVPPAGTTTAPAGTTDMTAPSSAGSSTRPGNSMGVEIITHPASGSAPAAAVPNPLKSVGPVNNTALPDAEKAATAPDVPNQVSAPTAAAQTVAPGKKAAAPAFDKADESSSKHKKKKGIKKLDPLPQ